MTAPANTYHITIENIASSSTIALNMLRSIDWQPRVWQDKDTLGAYIPKEDLAYVQAALEKLGLLGGSRFGVSVNTTSHSKIGSDRVSIRLSPSVVGKMAGFAIPQAKGFAEVEDEFENGASPRHRYERSRFAPSAAAKAIHDFQWEQIRLRTGERALQAVVDEKSMMYIRQKVSAFKVFPAMMVENMSGSGTPEEWRVTLLPQTVLAMAKQGVGVALSNLPKPSRHR